MNELTMNDYQSAALRTAKLLSRSASEQERHLNLSVLGLGIAGEAGEVADELKKMIGHGHPIDTQKLAKEIGDVLWYAAVLSDALGLDLEEVASKNISKLRERYPDGFDPERSLKRIAEGGRTE